MHTHVTFTSIEAYDGIKADGTLNRQQAAVMAAIAHGKDYSLQEIVKASGLPVNVVSGRCNELRKLGALELGPDRNCSITGRRIHPVRRPPAPGMQGALFS